MHKTSKRLLRSVLGMWVGIFFLFLTAGCEWGDRTISLIRPDTDDLQVVFTDTNTVRLSTVMKDSILTSATSGTKLLAGRLKDTLMGEVAATGFVLMQLESAITLEERAVYDSLVLSSKYAYAYGDTNQLHKLSVHALIDDITRGDYYNTSKSAYELKPMGEKTFRAEPGLYVPPGIQGAAKPKGLSITLSDAIGKRLFDAAAAGKLKSQDELMAVFKGFALVSGNTNGAGFLGFNSDSTTITMHYHVDGPDGKVKHSRNLKTLKYYNRVVNDRSKTAFAGLVSSRTGVPSENTKNTSVIQAGVGTMIRVDLPFLHIFKFNLGKVLVNRAFLRIDLPREQENTYMPVPSALGVYQTGKYNDWERNYALVGKAQLQHNTVDNERYYLIDLTSYVIQHVTSGAEPVGGLLLGPMGGSKNNETESYTNSLDRLVISGRNQVKLQVYYTNLIY